MGILGVDLININLDDVNIDGDDSEANIHINLMTWYNKLKQWKAFKKYISKELMPLAWHPTRWQDWSLPEDEKKEMEAIFADNVCRK